MVILLPKNFSRYSVASSAANLDERHDLVVRMLDAVYFDLSDSKSIIAIKPKAPFRPVFEVATAREGSGVILLQNEKLPAGGPGVDADLCSGWRRGRVGLPVHKPQ